MSSEYEPKQEQDIQILFSCLEPLTLIPLPLNRQLYKDKKHGYRNTILLSLLFIQSNQQLPQIIHGLVESRIVEEFWSLILAHQSIVYHQSLDFRST